MNERTSGPISSTRKAILGATLAVSERPNTGGNALAATRSLGDEGCEGGEGGVGGGLQIRISIKPFTLKWLLKGQDFFERNEQESRQKNIYVESLT